MKNKVYKRIKEDIEDILTRELEKKEALIDGTTVEGNLILEEIEEEYNSKLESCGKCLRDLVEGDFIPEETSRSSEFTRLVNQLGYGHIDEYGHFIENADDES